MPGKPKVGGSLFRAPAGTPYPTDEKTPLPAAYVSQGYLESSGFSKSIKKAYKSIAAYGGDEVENLRTEHGVSIKFSLIEVLNPNVVKTVYGADVTVTPATATSGTKTAVAYTGEDDEENSVWVAEFAYRKKVKRVVLTNCQDVTADFTEEYKDDEIISWPREFVCYKNDAGVHFFEYTDDGIKAV